MQLKVRLQAVPHRTPILRRRFHDHLLNLLLLEPSRQMLQFAPRRAELPLLVYDLAIPLLAHYYRQHALMHVDACHAAIH